MTAYLVLRDHPLKSGAEGPMIKIDELAEKQSDAGQESTVDVTACGQGREAAAAGLVDGAGGGRQGLVGVHADDDAVDVGGGGGGGVQGEFEGHGVLYCSCA